MNIYHYSLILLQSISFLIHLHKNGENKPERDLKYDAKTSFYSFIICAILVFLSSYN